MKQFFTAVVTKEDNLYVSECPELGIASQGLSLEQALENLKEAIELYFKDEEPEARPTSSARPLITTIEVDV